MIWVFAYLGLVVAMLAVAILLVVVMGMDARIEDAADDVELEPVVDVTELVEQYANRSRHPAWRPAHYTERQVHRGQ